MSPIGDAIPQVRVLIADDSTIMRTTLVRMLESSPLIRVCGTARNGVEAVQKTRILQPDVITMDVDMPMLDGIEALKQIMRENPCPVVMVSSRTLEGASVTLEALEEGAFDYLPKEDLRHEAGALQLRYQLVEKIEAAARSPLALRKRPFHTTIFPSAENLHSRFHVVPKLVVVGTSTGGPKALQEILPELPGDLPVGIFGGPAHAPRLHGAVCQAVERSLQIDGPRGAIWRYCGSRYRVAPAGQHTTVFYNRLHQPLISLSDLPSDTIHKPSVDVTMLSVAGLFGEHALGIILTGMGCDGLEGMTAIRNAGGITLGQDEASCAVYGMPRACADKGVLQKVVPLSQVPGQILSALHYRSNP